MLNSDTLLLLQLYWRLDRRADGGIGRFGWVRRAVLALALIGISALVGTAVGAVVQEGLTVGVAPDVVPGLLLALILIGTTISGFNQALQALYLSDDLEKLLVAPIPSRAVVTAKLLGRLPTVMFLMLGMTLPALIAFGIVLGLGPLYHVVGILLVLAAPLFGISLGAMVAIFLVRLLPARRLSEWVGAASIVIGTVISMLFYLPQLLRGNRGQLDPETEAAIGAALSRYADMPLPTNLAGAALIDLGEGRFTPGDLAGLLFYLMSTAGFFLATVLLADRLYLSGWLRLRSSGARTQGFTDEAGIFGGGSLDLILGYKDWLLRVRDARLLASMFSGVIVSVFVVVLLLRPNEDGGSIMNLPDDFQNNGFLGSIFSTGVMMSGTFYFVAWSAFSRVAASALSIERSAVTILKSAPVAPARLMRAKVLGVLIPYMLLATLLLILGLLFAGYSLLWTPYAWLVMLILGFGMIAYTVSLDFIYPNLTWEDPRRMTNRKAGLRSLIGTVIYSVTGGFIALGAFVAATAGPLPALPVAILGLAVLTGGTWFFVADRIRRVEAAWPTLGDA